jgi:hypothetical protein
MDIKMKKIYMFTTIIAAAIIILPTTTTLSYAQFNTTTTPQQQVTPPTTTPQAGGGEIFESEEGGFRIQVPDGWVAQDLTEEEEDYDEALDQGSAIVVAMCKQNEALPSLGGKYNCVDAQRTVGAGVTI